MSTIFAHITDETSVAWCVAAVGHTIGEFVCIVTLADGSVCCAITHIGTHTPVKCI